MNLQFLKNNLLKIIIVLITLLLAGLCIYTVLNYGSSSFSKNLSQKSITAIDNNLKIKSAKPNTHILQSSTPNSLNLSTDGNKSPKPSSRGFRSNSEDNKNRPNIYNNSSYSKYSSAFITYSLLFFTLSISIYLLFICKKIKLKNSDACALILGILIIGILLRIYSGLLIDGHPFDISLYKRWATNAANNILQIYDNNSSIDYPPVYIYILFVIGKLANTPIFNNYYYLFLKLPSIITDILSGYFIYKIAYKHLSKEFAILLSAFYIFNPAVLINSSIWGQSDSVFAFIAILSIFFLSNNKLVFSSVLFTILVLMKPQGIILLPLLLFELIKRRNIKSIIQCILPALLTAIIIILPFSINNGNITWTFNLYMSTIKEYPYASINAFNFFSLIKANMVNAANTMFILDYHTFGMIFIVLITIFSGFVYIKITSKYSAFIAALIQVVGVFNFSVGMHERYMFASIIISIAAYIYNKNIRLLILSALFTLIIYINTHSVLFDRFNGFGTSSYNLLTILTSFLNVVTFLYLVKFSIDLIRNHSKSRLD
ncbi:membrane protein [Clostridium pasteurianum]|uniref:membrane protein n=1 Tax=Clostridium pasteurianum TaxID=1501 RepID=UPI000557221F|nr:membrane protein [Clostridium pasteurianum]AOZ75918.1 hypothetical protein AQ983_12750 [Clostridium pasteurianum DSM 525 = ATCC 6013]AOZ79714.1 hypothetical protein AQ984_12745 [Clostridium pasteurianum]